MNLITILTPSEQQSLVFELHNAVNQAINKGYDEPSIVAYLTYLIPKHINKLKIGSAKGVGVSVGGVFVHQSPKVHFAGMVKQGSIEIGDLLLVSTFIQGSNTIRKAILYQAKRFKKLPVKPDNVNQHTLYEAWPDFEYVSPGELAGKKRQVKGLDLHSSAKYLLLRDGKPLSPTPFYILHPKFRNGMGITAHATHPLSNHECFIKEAYHFVLGDSGKEFVLLDDKSKDIGWSRVISDLIDMTAKRVTGYMKRASSGASDKRGVSVFGHGLSFIDSSVTTSLVKNDDNGELPPEDIYIPNGDSEGIPIIEIKVELGNQIDLFEQ